MVELTLFPRIAQLLTAVVVFLFQKQIKLIWCPICFLNLFKQEYSISSVLL